MPRGSSNGVVSYNFSSLPQSGDTKLLLEINRKLDLVLKELKHTGSFYKIIDNKRYLRSLLSEADKLAASGGRISEDEVQTLIDIVNKDNRVSLLEKNTLIYILNNYNLTKPAKNTLLKFTLETTT